MNYQAEYDAKRMSAEAVAAEVLSGWRIGMDSSAAQTPTLLHAVTERARRKELENVRVHTLLDVYPLELFTDSGLLGRLTSVAWFSGGGSRKAVNGGYGDVIPNYYRDVPALIRENYDYDAFFVSVSPMDKHGYFSLATVCSYSPAMLEKSRRVYVEVNDCQPRAVCGMQLHVSQITFGSFT